MASTARRVRGHCTTSLPARFLLLFAFLFLFSASAHAQSRTTLKFVFPFGDNTRTISVCPVPNRVIGGCCSDTNRIFTRDNKKGCCPTGNDIETVGTNQGCCYPVTPPQTRWGQTNSSPCGGYCAAGSAVLSYSTISSCCADCPHTDDVRAFMSSSKVCGTCCSKIPDNCGNAGYRVCEEATGSAYCSVDPTKCQPATDWITGSQGQGGYSCCASCAGTRYAHTSSDCGSCCATGTHSMLDYSGASSCCTVAATNQTRWSQSATNVCGQFCTGPNVMVSYNGVSSCCSSCLGNSRSGQTTTNVCGNACCDIMQITHVDAQGVPHYNTPICACPANTTKQKLNDYWGYDAGYACCGANTTVNINTGLVGGGGALGTYYRSFTSEGYPIGSIYDDNYGYCTANYKICDSGGELFGYGKMHNWWTNTAGCGLWVNKVSYYPNGTRAYFELGYRLERNDFFDIAPLFNGKRLGRMYAGASRYSVTYTNNSSSISFSYY